MVDSNHWEADPTFAVRPCFPSPRTLATPLCIGSSVEALWGMLEDAGDGKWAIERKGRRPAGVNSSKKVHRLVMTLARAARLSKEGMEADEALKPHKLWRRRRYQKSWGTGIE
jgi:hypothetical protein